MSIEFRKATQSDIDTILANARQENIDELQMFDGLDLPVALTQSIHDSSESYVAVINGDPVCAFGVVPSSTPDVGVPWMVGTSTIDQHGTAFLRGSKAVINDLLTRWPLLRNWADTRNVRGLRWLRFMGFTIHPAQPVGPKGMLFHLFEKGSI